MTFRTGLATTHTFRYLAALFIFSSLLVHSGVSYAKAEGIKAEGSVDDLFLIYCATDQGTFEGNILVPLQFLRTKPVLAELGLNEVQSAKIDEAFQATTKGLIQPFLQRGNHPDSPENFQRNLDAARRRTAEVLDSNQMRRFKGLMLQKYGPWSLDPRDFREILRLTPEQKTKQDVVREQLFVRINGVSQQPLAPKEAGVCKYAPIEGEAAKAILHQSEQSFLNILTPEQKEKLTKMKGKPAKGLVK